MTRTKDCISVKRFLLLDDPIQNTMRTYRPSKTRKTVRNTLIATMSIERRGKTIFKLTEEKEEKKKEKNDSFERDRRSEDTFEDGRIRIERLPSSRKVFDEYSLQKDSRRELWTSIGA